MYFLLLYCFSKFLAGISVLTTIDYAKRLFVPTIYSKKLMHFSIFFSYKYNHSFHLLFLLISSQHFSSYHHRLCKTSYGAHCFVGKVHVLLIFILFLLIYSQHFSSYHHRLCKTPICASKFTAKNSCTSQYSFPVSTAIPFTYCFS